MKCYKNAVIITGPTSVGKTKIIAEIAKRLNGEVIHCDRFLLYNIFLESGGLHYYDKKKITHHLYGILNPTEKCLTPKQYSKKVNQLIKNILKKGRLPIIDGFSSKYFNEFLKNNNILSYSPIIGIAYPKDFKLLDLINRRINNEVNIKEVIQEARHLKERKLLKESFFFKNSLYYKSVLDYLDGKISIDKIKSNWTYGFLLAIPTQFDYFEGFPALWIENNPKNPKEVINKIINLINHANTNNFVKPIKHFKGFNSFDKIKKGQREILKIALKDSGINIKEYEKKLLDYKISQLEINDS